MSTDFQQQTLGDGTAPADYDGQLGDGKDKPTILETDGDETRCPYCGQWYELVASHWTKSSCQYPPFTARKQEILTGMMLGDGYMKNTGGRFGCKMTNKTFIEWLAKQLGWLAHDVRLKQTATESAKDLRERGFSGDTDATDCRDKYRFWTVTHPALQQFCDWYDDDGNIHFPTDLSLTPLSLKLWYVSDGGLDCSQKHPRIYFGSANEQERPDAIMSMLKGCGFDVSQSGYNFRLPTAQTEDFLDYIGSPPPGFEYKWAIDSREQYDKLKEQMIEEHCTQTLA
jgi:uncharacterized Zn-finger protein